MTRGPASRASSIMSSRDSRKRQRERSISKDTQRSQDALPDEQRTARVRRRGSQQPRGSRSPTRYVTYVRSTCARARCAADHTRAPRCSMDAPCTLTRSPGRRSLLHAGPLARLAREDAITRRVSSIIRRSSSRASPRSPDDVRARVAHSRGEHHPRRRRSTGTRAPSGSFRLAASFLGSPSTLRMRLRAEPQRRSQSRVPAHEDETRRRLPSGTHGRPSRSRLNSWRPSRAVPFAGSDARRHVDPLPTCLRCSRWRQPQACSAQDRRDSTARALPTRSPPW